MAQPQPTVEEAEYFRQVSQMPAVLKFAHMMFGILLDRAQPEELEIPAPFNLDPEITTTEALVFRGKFGDLYDEIGASKSYYSQVRELLLKSNSIIILERGTIHSPSVILVNRENRPPMTREEASALVSGSNVKSSPEPLTESSEAFILLSTRVEALSEQLKGVSIVEVARNFENRIASLEREIRELKKPGLY